MRQVAIWVAGGVGLSIVARAAALYRGTDRLAFGLVMLIAMGLVIGIAELVARVRRAEAMAREVAQLPAEPAEASVEGASPAVRAFLRARIAGSAGAAVAPPMASYLVGLLVMIGLLGTFLGLFESLRGARDALGASADPATLRAGLAAPIQGLSRAFGTSAAGVSASAMLGLALVVLRRAEADVQGALAAYATGPLAPLTVARRTLAALESMARQGSVLPEASEALVKGAASLADVAREVRGSMDATTAVVRDELRAVAANVREDLRGSAEATARAVSDAVAPRLDAAVAAVGASGRAQSDALAKSLAAEGDARAARERAHLEAMQAAVARESKSMVESVSTTLRSTSDAVGASLLEVADGIAKKLASQAEADAARDERLSSLLTKIDAVATEIPSTHARSSSQLAEELASHQRMLDAAAATRLEAHAEEVAARLASFTERLENVRAELRADDHVRAEAMAEQLEKQLAALADKQASFVSGLEAQAADVASRLASFAERLENVRSELRGDDAVRAQSIAQQLEHQLGALAERQASFAARLEALATETATQLASWTERIENLRHELRADDQIRADVLAEQVEKQLGALAEKQAGFVGDLEKVRAELRADDDARVAEVTARMETQLAALAASVSSSLESVVKSVAAAPEAAARVIDDAAERLRVQLAAESAREARVGELVERVGSLASTVEAASAARLDAHAAATSEQLEAHLEALALSVASSLEGVMKSVEKSREADAAQNDRVAALLERFDQLSSRIDEQTAKNAERILELEIKLEEVYAKSTEAWSERLSTHTATVQDRFLETTVVVKEAAEALAKSGQGVGALGELFGASVDRYREASDKWLTGLSLMRAAAERAAHADAQDLLAAYLEQTREVFDQTLAFQRQLFAELRKANPDVNVIEHPVGEAE